tara:strand:- start:412 stop:639 length:228 start_codon:yes stop_codon:yes gene_type:complete
MEKNLEKFKKLVDKIDVIDYKGNRYILLFNSDNLKAINLQGLSGEQRFGLANIVINLANGTVIKNRFGPTNEEVA